jgi:excisionase family DNA binding protein
MASHANSWTYVSEVQSVSAGWWSPPPSIEAGTTKEAQKSHPPITKERSPKKTHLPATMSIPDAAAYLGIGRSAAYEAARSGELPVIRLGRRLLVPRVALERMLAECSPSFEADREGKKR